MGATKSKGTESPKGKNSLNLKFRSKDVAKFERDNGSIFEHLEPTVDNLAKLISAGKGGCKIDDAYKELDTYLENGGDTLSALVEITESLQNGGFFPRQIQIKRMLEETINEHMSGLDMPNTQVEST
jgi:hypothetical protein